MTEIDQSKTVFISYRRSVSEWQALLIATHLRANGYDVFFDQDSINNGEFSQYILNEIKARDHFLLLLAEGTMDRCTEAGDWLRTEVETAIELKRNIVPLIIDDFDLSANKKLFPDKLGNILQQNGCPLPSPYFFEDAMDKLQDRFFKDKKVAAIPITEIEEEQAIDQIKGVKAQEPVDTIIVRGEPEDVAERFIKSKRWYPVNIGKQWQRLIKEGVIKYVAIYESEEINAIRYYAEIAGIKTWMNKEDQQVIWIEGDKKDLRQHVKRNPNGRERSLNRPRYTSLAKIKDSKTLDDLFENS